MEIKACCTCKKEQNLSNFPNWKASKDGKGKQCKDCMSLSYKKKTANKFGMVEMPKCIECNSELRRHTKTNYCRNHVYLHETVKSRAKKYKEKVRINRTPEQIEKDKIINKKATLKYRELRKDRLREFNKKWVLANPEKCKEIQAKSRGKKRLSQTFRIGCRISSSMRRTTKNYVSKKGAHWEKLVGYTAEQLKQHLENRFTEGMTWDRFMASEIHIDHIIPHSYFKYTSTNNKAFKMCWDLENLQPLWATDNLKKKDKLPPDLTQRLQYLEQKYNIINKKEAA